MRYFFRGKSYVVRRSKKIESAGRMMPIDFSHSVTYSLVLS